MSLRVDLDQLRGLAKEVRSLGDQASSVIAPASSDSDPMSSVRAARQLTQSVFLGTLVPTIAERLTETAESMAAAAQQFQSRDEASAHDLAEVLTNATGEWGGGNES